MTFYVSWSGLGAELPDFDQIARHTVHGAEVTHGQPVIMEADPVGVEYARHVGHLLEHWASEHSDELLKISLSGHAQEIDTGIHSTLHLSLTTTPVPEEERAVDSSISGDPFAPEPETKPDAPEPQPVDETGEPIPAPEETAEPAEPEPAVDEPEPDPEPEPATPEPESEVQ